MEFDAGRFKQGSKYSYRQDDENKIYVKTESGNEQYFCKLDFKNFFE
jgi:hypothetical protein